MAKPKAPEVVYQLKVTLLGSEPPIWRRLLVARNVTLKRLHAIIQIAMGWQTSHLHLFETALGNFAEPASRSPCGQGPRAASRAEGVARPSVRSRAL